MKKEITQHITLYKSDISTPIGLYLKFIGKNKGILLESAEVDGRLGRYSLLAWDFKFCLKCKHGSMHVEIMHPEFDFLKEFEGRKYFQALDEIISIINPIPQGEVLPPITRSLIGYIGYECVSMFEPILQKNILLEQAESIFVLPGKQILYDHLHYNCFYISLDKNKLKEPKQTIDVEGEIKIGKIENSFTKQGFVKAVEQTKDLIFQGEAIQVVLSNRFSSNFSGDPFTVYRKLRQTNPSPYMFFLNLNDICLIGSSPELMVRSSNGVAEVRPIAGTRRRGTDKKEDNALAEELINDPKERAEHVMLVDLGRNDLGRIAKPGSVEVVKFMQIERFSHVMHLTSYVKSKIKDSVNAIDILKATFPAGTVSGAPKIRAMQIISDMEAKKRGPYAGAIGWIGLGDNKMDLDTGIIIRSIWIKGNKIFWQAGAGIVADSIPEKEWQECLNKAKVIHKVLAEQSPVKGLRRL